MTDMFSRFQQSVIALTDEQIQQLKDIITAVEPKQFNCEKGYKKDYYCPDHDIQERANKVGLLGFCLARQPDGRTCDAPDMIREIKENILFHKACRELQKLSEFGYKFVPIKDSFMDLTAVDRAGNKYKHFINIPLSEIAKLTEVDISNKTLAFRLGWYRDIEKPDTYSAELIAFFIQQ